MNIEQLLASARPFLFHEDTADATLSSNPRRVRPTPGCARRPSTVCKPAPAGRPNVPHALLRLSHWQRYSLLGVFEDFQATTEYGSRYGYNTRPTLNDIKRSVSTWRDHRGSLFVICPHPNPDTELRINPDHDTTRPGQGRFCLKYADNNTRIHTQVRFETPREAYACLAVSRNLDNAIARVFEPAIERWEWRFEDGARYIIQGRKPMKRTRWTIQREREGKRAFS